MADSSIQNFIVKGGLEVADSAIFSGDVVIDSSANLTLSGGVSRLKLVDSGISANQVIVTDGSGNLNYANPDDIISFQINGLSGAENGDLLIYDSDNGNFRLSRVSEQHIINGGQY